MNYRMKNWYGMAILIMLLQTAISLAQVETSIFSESVDKRVLVPKFEIGDEWRNDIGFDDNAWELVSGAPGGIGYESGSGYEGLISYDVGSDMQESGGNPNPGCYVRIKFNLTQEEFDAVHILLLHMRYDDGFVAFLNGQRVAEANAPQNLLFSSTATNGHEANGQEAFTVRGAASYLNVGENLLAVHALNTNLTSSDFLINVQAIAKNNPFENFEFSKLPLVYINTNGKNIPNDPKITAHMGIIYNGDGELNNVNGAFNDYDGSIGIETRGSTSQGWPKKQYAVETRDENGDNFNVSLMGLPKENDWVLNAPFYDRSFLKNVLVFDLSRRMGNYASRSRFCELFLNGEYRGIYVLLEKIKRDKNRVDVASLDSTDIAGEPLTGGYIIKVDKLDGEKRDGFTSRHLPAGDSERKTFYQFHYPSFDDMLPVQRNYIEDYIHSFENMMVGTEFNDPVNGYPAWIDIDSFIDFFIVSEFSKNIDAYRLSSFLYKDRDSNDGRLHAGPIWDFNISFGMVNYYDGTDTDDWILEQLLYTVRGGDYQVPFWWEKLLNDPQFNHKIKQRWVSLRGNVFNLNRITNYLDAVADTLDEAQERNFSLWPNPGQPGTGFWPQPSRELYSPSNYQEEIQYLKSWITHRISWMDANVLLFSDVESRESAKPGSFVLRPNYPNPFNPATTIEFEAAGTAFVKLEIFNVAGQRIKVLLDGKIGAGLHTFSWDGSNTSGAAASSGIYTVRATVQNDYENSITSSKMLLIR
jgi:hypothetical protein